MSTPQPERPEWIRTVPDDPPPDRTDLLLDGAGIILVAAAVGWLHFTASLSGGDARRAAGMLGLAVVGYLVASIASRFHPWIPALLVTVGSVVYALSWGSNVSDGPLDGPLGYSNAAGAYFLLAAGAALIVVARARDPIVRGGCALAALAFGAVPWWNGAMTPAVLMVILPAALAASSERATRAVVVLSALAILTSFAATIVLAVTYSPDRGAAEWIDATLSERRLELWSDAVYLIGTEPLTGIGPNLFPEVSAAAQADRDTIWPHSEILHFGAEMGLVGLALFLALTGWGFARLWWGGGDVGAAVAAASFGAVGVHSNVDYILHYPAVVVLALVLVGIGSRDPRSEGTFIEPPAA